FSLRSIRSSSLLHCFFLTFPRPPSSSLFPYTTLFRSRPPDVCPRYWRIALRAWPGVVPDLIHLEKRFQILGQLSSFFGFPVVQLRSRVFLDSLNALVRLRVNKFLCIPHRFFGCSHVLGLHVHNRSFHLPDRQSQQWRNALLIVLRF